jgi:hypothetical protein
MEFHYPKIHKLLERLVKERALFVLIGKIPKILSACEVKELGEIQFQNGGICIDIQDAIDYLKNLKEIDSILVCCCSRPKKPLKQSQHVRTSLLCPFYYKEFQALGLQNLSSEFCILLNGLSLDGVPSGENGHGLPANQRLSVPQNQLSGQPINQKINTPTTSPNLIYTDAQKIHMGQQQPVLKYSFSHVARRQ